MFISEQIMAFFKRAIAGFLTFIIMTANLADWNIDVGGVHGMREDYAYSFAYSSEKIKPDDILGKKENIRVNMGKNEREGLQFIFRSRYKKKIDFVLELSDVSGPDGAVIPAAVFKESYINVAAPQATGEYPDALIPYNGEACFLPLRTNQGFYIELRTDANTPAGVYSGTISVHKWEHYVEGEMMVEVDFSVEVLDVTFPDAAYNDTAVGLWGGQFYTLNGVKPGTPEGTALYKQYYDYLLDHKISAYDLPYDILDSNADEYMSDERVKSFMIPYSGDDATLQAYYNKVQSNPDWAQKAYFYPIDEPYMAAHINTYNNMTDRLTALCPDYHMVTPVNAWVFEEDGVQFNNLEIQNGRSDIICPISNLYDEKGFAEAVAKRVNDNGDRAWWYVCISPKGDYANLFINQQGTRHRVLFWQQYQQGLTGLLYWDSVYWDRVNPWLSSATFIAYDGCGDGSWFYPGAAVGLNEPIPSLRLKNITDGLEDYDLLRMAEEQFGRDYCLKKAALLSESLTSYTQDPAKIENVRLAILKDLAK